jgi:hypothetical protein
VLRGESGRGCDGKTAGILHVDRYRLPTLYQHIKFTPVVLNGLHIYTKLHMWHVDDEQMFELWIKEEIVTASC